MAIIDVRQKSQIQYLIDNGVSDVLTIAGITNLDTGYTLTMGTETFTVGSGLTLGANSIAWALDTTVFGAGTYSGSLVSDSKVGGVYLKIDIELIIDDN